MMNSKIHLGTLEGDSKKISDEDQMMFDPNLLLDALHEKLHLKNDRALSFALGIAAPALSKIRHRKLAVGAALLIRMHEITGLTIVELRSLMGDHRKRLYVYNQHVKPKKT